MKSEARRLEEILDDCLLRIQEHGATLDQCLRAYPAAARELRPLIETALTARATLAPREPSPEFLAAAEIRLRRKVQAARASGTRAGTGQPSVFSRGWLRVGILFLVLAALLGSLWGAIPASAQALPGDAWYPAKLGVERINLALSLTPAGDANLLLQYSDRRVEEIRRLVGKNRDQDLAEGFNQYQTTLTLLDAALQQLPADSDSGLLEEAHIRLSGQADVLSDLRPFLPVPAQELLDRAVGQSLQSQELIQNIRQGEGPVVTPPGQLKKETKQPDHPNSGGGKPVITEKPTHTQKEPKPITSTPKPKSKK